jgi:predicted metal-dependent phosphoesterase TrpH
MSNVSASSEPATPALQWLKADFHLHTAEDPYDDVDYSALELLEIAHCLGFSALAITLHRCVFFDEAVIARALELGIRLIPAGELFIEGADAVVLNISPEEAEGVKTFDDLRRLRAERGDSIFVLAPHPYFILGGSIGQRLEKELDCFDAIEFCHLQIPLLNPNRRAAKVAARAGKPMLSTSDAHKRLNFGHAYSLIGVEAGDGPPSIEALFGAMRAHRVRRVNPPKSFVKFVLKVAYLLVVNPFMRNLPGSKRSKRRQGARAAEPERAPMGVPVRGSSVL